MIEADKLVLRGVHHTAFPTWKPKSTVEFYRDALGLPVRHAITAKGWGRKTEQHPDFLHFFFDTGDDNMLAFFYYIGTQPHPALAELRGYLALSRHTAWAAKDVAELQRWRDRIAASGVRVSEAIEHEILHSIYFRDPNGYDMEITTQIRPLNDADTRDAELSVQAMVDVFGDDNPEQATIHEFWQRKGQIVGAELRAQATAGVIS
jgi:catechol 2,3-dioxygenase-like lactoylglutathione lyase family enzyme